MKTLPLILLLLCPIAFADYVELEVGGANASYEWTGAHYARISARFGWKEEWALGMAHTGEQSFSKCPDGPPEWDCHYNNIIQNIYVDLTRYFRWKAFEFGIGPSVSQNSTRTTPEKLNFHLQLGLKYKRLSLYIHHYSNAGTSPTGYNMGQDSITIGYR